MVGVNIVVQARMGSTRLPGKMMLDLYGEPLIFRILERLKRCRLVDNVILAIPDDDLNNILYDTAIRLNDIKVVRGSEKNLIKRYQCAIEQFPCDHVIRFPGDNVFPDPIQIDRLIKFHVSHNSRGFSSNIASVFGNNMIDGVGAEIFSTSLLMNLSPDFSSEAQKEHLHLNFYDYGAAVAVNPSINVDAPSPEEGMARPEYVLDINTIEQYPLIRDIYKNVCFQNELFTTESIIKYLDTRAS